MTRAGLVMTFSTVITLAFACGEPAEKPRGVAAQIEPAAEPDPAPAAPVADAAPSDDGAPPPNGSAGCLSPVAPGIATETIEVAGRRRTFVRSVPPAYDARRAHPLVFVFHSGGRTGASAREYFGFESIAEDRAVFLYPDGVSGEWDLETPSGENRDVLLFDALLAQAKATMCIDAKRVFATGSSMGAFLANQLGCRRGADLRAIAPHAGGGPWDVASAYDDEGHLLCPTPPVAAMVFHGSADPSVSLDDGKASRDHWAHANGCTGAPEKSPSAPAPCLAYAGCARPVVWCEIPGGTHRIWRDGPKATWDFFASF